MSDEPLSSLYLDPARYDLLAQMTAPADLPLYLRLVERYGGPVLEMGCGSGRLAVSLAAAGVDVAGVDLSEPMIEAARRKAASSAISCLFQVADLRDLSLGMLPSGSINSSTSPCASALACPAFRAAAASFAQLPSSVSAAPNSDNAQPPLKYFTSSPGTGATASSGLSSASPASFQMRRKLALLIPPASPN